MPIYLCKPGWSMPEPWRHGLQVYACPFLIDEVQPSSPNTSDQQQQQENRTLSINPNSPVTTAFPGATTTARNDRSDIDNNGIMEEHREESNNDDRTNTQEAMESSVCQPCRPTTTPFGGNRTSVYGLPIRRVRHAEVILVDEVCSHFGRYWLRLRWPGSQGGFAGYIALGSVERDGGDDIPAGVAAGAENAMVDDGSWRRASSNVSDGLAADVNINTEQEATNLESEEENERISREERRSPDVKKSNQKKSLLIRCPTTGFYYPSSSAMELLHSYDDGISDQPQKDGEIRIEPVDDGSDEPVFCRICREGLHDISYDPGNSSTTAPFESIATAQPASDHTNTNTTTNLPPQQQAIPNRSDDEGSPPPNPNTASSSILLHQATSSHPTAENPMLAPCECSGSIAFVHYLCIEQWRCRSRHPAAQNGLNCETCGGKYTLPPPPSRPVERPEAGALLDDDWLEAMPAHVLAALRRPHFWWQVGAALVRRKWLRPIVPVIISPIVALYCRARRMLKKRGVSRRRWACSLCRRRARWKCVRCLRSYYCSRQCQNVSWHIVHKHVCYKPVRFWWSVLFYTLLLLLTLPGIVKNPLVYGTGLASLPSSFLAVGVLSGYAASITKKLFKVDIRGRTLEMSVVICTLKVAYASWAIILAFFGNTKNCSDFPCTSMYSSAVIKLATTVFFNPIYSLLTIADTLLLQKVSLFSSFICQPQNNSDLTDYYCLQNVQNADPTLGGQCSFDIVLLMFLWTTAGLVTLSGIFLKKNNNNHNREHHNREGVGNGRDRLGGGRVVMQRADRLGGGRAVVMQRAGRGGQPARPHQD